MKDVILKVSVPEGCKVNNLECHTPEKGYFHPKIEIIEPPTDEIRAEMDSDMEESGMAQGEIESCLTHWNNKYLIIRKP